MIVVGMRNHCRPSVGIERTEQPPPRHLPSPHCQSIRARQLWVTPFDFPKFVCSSKLLHHSLPNNKGFPNLFVSRKAAYEDMRPWELMLVALHGRRGGTGQKLRQVSAYPEQQRPCQRATAFSSVRESFFLLETAGSNLGRSRAILQRGLRACVAHWPGRI